MNVVITGGTKGIGRALVEHFAAEGANVAFSARTAADVEAFAKLLSERFAGQQFLGLVADMSDKAATLAFGEAVAAAWSSVDVLVNNAGVFVPCPITDPANEGNFRLMMDTNLYSAYYTTQSLLPCMIGQPKAHIFNMCSIASFMPYDSYSVSKFALLGYSKVLREELKTKGVRVTAVMPGAVLTNSWAGTELPDTRFMKSEDIAAAVWACYKLSAHTVVEELVLRPQLGDI
jgi:NAD(P)-dependent dehydrogenase (short-subunit alcohol dehydrogenase family)